MIRDIYNALSAWRDDPAVHLVLVDSTSERAFCAGGDVRTIRGWIMAGEFAAIEAFFADEYALNLAIARYPKPYVALIDGICMGGGVGLSVHGSFRVVTEHARFAMPEVQVGMFPDVGASFVLPRLRGEFGRYLGLTGTRAGGADACWLGLATHFVPRQNLTGLADDLAQDGLGALVERAQAPPPGELAAIADEVTQIFAAPGVDAITAALEASGSDWARTALSAMRTASPTVLRWTFDLLRDGARLSLEECQHAELALTRRVTRHPDFVEGVRAMLIDKDRQPRWACAGS